MHKLAQLSGIVMVKNSVIAVLKIPLINKTIFTCSKIKPIPYERSGALEKIVIQGNYILQNNNTKQFCVRNEQEMQKCLRLFDNVFCELDKTFETILSDNCEINLAMNKQNNNCAVMKYESNSYLEKVEPRSWLFSMHKINISVICKHKTMNGTMHEIGLLPLAPRCRAILNNTMIKSLDYNTSNISLSTTKWHTISLPARTVTKPFSHLEISMRELREETELHRILHVHHTTILYIFIGWVLFCCSVLFLRKFRNKN